MNADKIRLFVGLAVAAAILLIIFLSGYRDWNQSQQRARAEAALPLAAPAFKVLSKWSQVPNKYHQYRYIEIGGRVAIESTDGDFAFVSTPED